MGWMPSILKRRHMHLVPRQCRAGIGQRSYALSRKVRVADVRTRELGVLLPPAALAGIVSRMSNPPPITAATSRVVLDHIESLGYHVHIANDAETLVLVTTHRETGERHMVRSTVAEHPAAVAELAVMVGIDPED